MPKDVKADGKFRKIYVKVRGDGLTVHARKGYFAPEPGAANAPPPTADLDPEVRRALDAPRDLADVPVRATALSLIKPAPTRPMWLSPPTWMSTALRSSPGRVAASPARWNSRSPPPLAEFRMSSPILTDALQTDSTGKTPKPLVLPRRTFLEGSTLFCQFSAYGAKRDGDGRPRVSSNWLLRRADGSLVRQVLTTTIESASDGGLVRMYGIALSGLVPGDYQITLAVRDELAVKVVEMQEPFAVVRRVGLAVPPSR